MGDFFEVFIRIHRLSKMWGFLQKTFTKQVTLNRLGEVVMGRPVSYISPTRTT
jgi:hypothetical protein